MQAFVLLRGEMVHSINIFTGPEKTGHSLREIMFMLEHQKSKCIEHTQNIYFKHSVVMTLAWGVGLRQP
jgi:predicted RecA/RadA family phage recombinase